MVILFSGSLIIANVFHEFYVVDKCVCGRQRHVHWLLAYASCLRLLPAQ